jgi:hypothetical protein
MCTFGYHVNACGCDSKKNHYCWRDCVDKPNCTVVEEITRRDYNCATCEEKERRAKEKAEKKVEWRPWRWGDHGT